MAVATYAAAAALLLMGVATAADLTEPTVIAESEPAPPPNHSDDDEGLRPGSEAHTAREKSRREGQARQQRIQASANSLAPRAAALAKKDRRFADLLSQAVLKREASEPITDGVQAVGAVVAFSIPTPTDFVLDYASLNLGEAANGIATVRVSGLAGISIHVNLAQGTVQRVEFDEYASWTTYDAEGRAMLESSAVGE